MKYLIRIALLSLTIILASCGKSTHINQTKINELKSILSEKKSTLPLINSVYGRLDSLAYNDDKEQLEFYLSADQAIKLDLLKQHEDILRKFFSLGIYMKGEYFKPMLQSCSAAGANLAVEFTDWENNKSTLTYKPNEIESLLFNQHRITEEERLLMHYELTKVELPQTVDEETTLYDASLDEKYFTYYYDVKEASLTVPHAQEHHEEFKQNLLSFLSMGSLNNVFVYLVNSTNRGIRHIYRGEKTGETMEIIIDNDELLQSYDPGMEVNPFEAPTTTTSVSDDEEVIDVTL